MTRSLLSGWSGTSGRIVLLLLASAVGIGVVELGLRVYAYVGRQASLRDLAGAGPLPAPGTRVELGELLVPSRYERLIFELRPGLDVRFRGVWVRTSSPGWRGPAVSLEKPVGTIRILGIGDSVMFGWGVRERSRYLDRLVARLNEAYPDRRWQALPLAAPGYNLPMEVEALRRHGLAYDPDMILYGYVANDRCLPNFVAGGTDPLGRGSFLLRALSEAALPSAGLLGRDEVLDEAVATADFATRYCQPESVPERYRDQVGREAFERSLLDLEAIARERGIPAVLVTHPLLDAFPWPEVPEGIELVYGTGRPGEPGSLAPRGRDRIDSGDPHPNEAAHDRIAERIFDSLRSSGVWDRLRGGAPGPIHPPEERAR